MGRLPMGNKLLPTNDLAFKKAFADARNTDVLRGLINDFFGLDPEEIIVKHPYDIELYKKEFREAKARGEEVVLRQTLRDITASLVFADFTSEMQVVKEEYFAARSMYYTFREYCGNYGKEDEMKIAKDLYSSLKPVYSLNILCYNMFKSDRAFRVFKIFDDVEQEEMTSLIIRGGDEKTAPLIIRAGYFEVNKTASVTENQEHWRKFFLTGEADKSAPGYIKKAAEIIGFMNLSEEERNMAIMIDKARADYDAGLASAEYRGKIEGKVEGKIEGKIEAVIDLMTATNTPLSKAAQILKFPESEKGKLLSELQARGVKYTP
jgi:predicted transposase/invertase (TIGR01784 family)